MLTRLTHAAIAFAVTAILYQGYVLGVAPFIEPPGVPELVSRRATPEQLRDGRAAVEQYQDLLAAYFPADHWCRQQPPKFFDNGQVMIVLNKYEQTDAGKLNIPHCAIIFFPPRADRGAAPPADAVVLEPSQGAVLQMDRKLDKGVGVGGFGRMQYGQLLGEVVVRSNMREPGTADDLLITTRDLYMNENFGFIRTNDAVQMKMGAHFGRGRGLEIRLLRSEARSSGAGGMIYGRLESLQILHEVAVEIAPGNLSLMGKKRSKPAVAATDPRRPAAAPTESPIRVQSAGPFRIEFTHDLATFVDDVHVRQLHPGGLLDELVAQELRLYFAKAQKWNSSGAGTADVPPGGDEPKQSAMAFELASIIAEGTPEAPVRMNAPSHEATAVGQRLWIELIKRKITLDKGEEVMLSHRGAEIHAPMVEYQLPPKGAMSRVGAMAARGSGWLRAIIDPTRPDGILEVRWTAAMQLIRRNGQPVLVLDGRPRVQHLALGTTLWADELQIFLRELADRGGARADEGESALPSSVVPELITADGRVAIESPELTGKVNRLEVMIDHSQASIPLASSQADGGGVAGGAGPGGLTTQSLMPQGSGARAQRAYDISGVVLKVGVAMRDRRAQVTSINVDGAVDFKELSPTDAGAPAMRIVAEHLKVSGVDTPNAEIEVRGGGQNGQPTQMADINARGTRISAPMFTVNRGTGRAWVNSPGEVEMLVAKDLSGQPLAQPEKLLVTWQKSMELVGARIGFHGDVRVTRGSDWLRTTQLVVQLSAPVRFDGSAVSQQPEVEQLECWGGALASFDQRDKVTGEVTAKQLMEVVSLIANQRTGALSGDGPGWIDSVHFSKSSDAWIAAPGVAAQPTPFALAATSTAEDASQLRRLHIDFVRGVGGNLHHRTVNVQGNVKAVYGPVNDWEERLTMSPGGSPGPNTVWITCDQLGVTESPASRLATPPTRQVELAAEGRVVIEGQDAKRGAFNATGHRATYDQAKAMFILEGDGRTPATISNQQYPGAPASPQSAQKMTFWQNTGELKVEGLQKGQINQFDLDAR